MAKRLIRVQSLLAKIETTEGSDISPATANAIRVASPLALELGAEVQNLRQDVVTEILSKLGPLPPGAKFARLTIPWQMRGFASAYSASNLPEADVLFRISAMSQTVVTTGGSESVTYELLTSTQESATLYFFVDGKRRKMLGCRGTFTYAGEAGQPLVFTFTISGIYVAETDTALVAGTYQTGVPPIVRGASSLVYNSVSTLIARRFAGDIGNTVVSRLSVNATDALAGFHVTDRNPTSSFVCEDPLIAEADFQADWAAATQRTLDYQVAPASGAQYNRCKIHHDKFTPGIPAYSNDNGLELVTVSGNIGNEGTEDMSLIFD